MKKQIKVIRTPGKTVVMYTDAPNPRAIAEKETPVTQKLVRVRQIDQKPYYLCLETGRKVFPKPRRRYFLGLIPFPRFSFV